jgi:alpha-D-ribose 1-methylphosphonate 5-triphosphate diphosphatase
MNAMSFLITRGQMLADGHLVDGALRTDGHLIDRLGRTGGATPARALDAAGLLVLPGIVDLHGDAFERQMMPRPGVDFPLDVALLDSDRQAVANGLTTVFHGVTWSWEPGLRSGDNARRLAEGMEQLRPRLLADTRLHLRHETYNLDAEPELRNWLAAGRIALFAFNDHMDSTVAALAKPHKRSRMVERSGLGDDAFGRLAEQVASRADAVPASIARLAAAARAAGVRMLSHDDRTPAQRADYRALGATIAEFPVNVETAQAAAAAGDPIVFGAPNVVRGGSHTGWTKAADMIAQGLCSVLASDYYYPAPLLAAFRLAADGVRPLGEAWSLVSEGPASAAGLTDRGVLAEGRRADILLVDAAEPLRPRVVAVIAGGRLVHLTEPARLSGDGAVRQPAAA